MKKGHLGSIYSLSKKKRANLDANLVLLRTDIINVVGIFCWMHINPAAAPDTSALCTLLPFNTPFLIQYKYSRLKSQLGGRVIQEVVKNRAAAAAHLICSLPSVG